MSLISGEKALVNHHSWGPGEKEVAPYVRIPGQRASSFCLSLAASRLASNSNQKWLLLQSKKKHVAGAESVKNWASHNCKDNRTGTSIMICLIDCRWRQWRR